MINKRESVDTKFAGEWEVKLETKYEVENESKSRKFLRLKK